MLRNNSGSATTTAGITADATDVRAKSTQDAVSAQSDTLRTTTTGVQQQQQQQQSWFQLSGHPDCFAPAGLGTIWKKCSGGTERDVYEALSNEPSLQDIVPKYYREVEYNGQTFIELQDLLSGFRDPNVIDIKMGTRTFLESEVKNTSARQDLYLKVSTTYNKFFSFPKHLHTLINILPLLASPFYSCPPNKFLTATNSLNSINSSIFFLYTNFSIPQLPLLIKISDNFIRYFHVKLN